MAKDLEKLIETIVKEKGVDRAVVIQAMVDALVAAAKRKYGHYRDFQAQYNEETGQLELFEMKEVVSDSDFFDEELEIPLSQARGLDPDAQVGDVLGIPLPVKDLGRIAAQTARGVLNQRVRDAEAEVISEEFEKRKGEIASGIVRRFEKDTVVVDLGRVEAYMPKKEQIPGETYKMGDRVQGYISEVRPTPRGPKIIISRSDDRYLIKLFEQEVPEIQEGIVELVSVARDPGSRAKIAVRSLEPNVDPVGSCVGMKGSRIHAVIQELSGEKIDVILWDEDISKFALNALQPARVSRIILDEDNKIMEVIVPDDQLSLAIGKKGQNVRLASKLIGWRIDVMSESYARAKENDAIFNLTQVPEIDQELAYTLYQYGITHPKQLLGLPGSELVGIGPIDSELKALEFLDQVQKAVARLDAQGWPQSPWAEVLKKGQNMKDQADARLKQELEKLQRAEGVDYDQEGMSS